MTDEREVPELRPIREEGEREKELPRPGETAPLLRTPGLSTLRELIQLSRQSRMSAQDFLFFLLALKQLEGFSNPNPEVAELRAKLEAMEREREEERLRRVMEEAVRRAVGPLQARLEVVERAVLGGQAPGREEDVSIERLAKETIIEEFKEWLKQRGYKVPKKATPEELILKGMELGMEFFKTWRGSGGPEPKQVEPIPEVGLKPKPEAKAGGEVGRRGGGGGKGEAGERPGKRG